MQSELISALLSRSHISPGRKVHLMKFLIFMRTFLFLVLEIRRTQPRRNMDRGGSSDTGNPPTFSLGALLHSSGSNLRFAFFAGNTGAHTHLKSDAPSGKTRLAPRSHREA